MFRGAGTHTDPCSVIHPRTTPLRISSAFVGLVSARPQWVGPPYRPDHRTPGKTREPPMKTAATEMLDIEFPIFAFSHCRDVVAAVSKAGGLGVLGAVSHSPEQLEIDLAWIEAEIGDRPYGIDLIVPAKYAGDEGGGYTLDDIAQLIPDTHRAFVNDILARYDVPELPADDTTRTGTSISGHDGNAPFSANSAGPQLEIALAFKTAFVANALGPPPQFLIDRVKEEGRLIGALAGKAVHAERHVNAGVDIIIAQGSEAGGHT